MLLKALRLRMRVSISPDICDAISRTRVFKVQGAERLSRKVKSLRGCDICIPSQDTSDNRRDE